MWSGAAETESPRSQVQVNVAFYEGVPHTRQYKNLNWLERQTRQSKNGKQLPKKVPKEGFSGASGRALILGAGVRLKSKWNFSKENFRTRGVLIKGPKSFGRGKN